MWNYSSMTNPGPETLEVWTALLVAHRRLTTQLDAELRAGADMTLDEYDVLYQLRRAGRPLRMSELASQVLISRPSTTRVADHLVQRGWLERWHDDTDRRVVLVGLTTEGKRAQARAGRLHLDGITRLVEAPLAGHELRRVAGALRVLAGSTATVRVDEAPGAAGAPRAPRAVS
jgi:DNA-binding MarR family transcriptional regulator